MYFFQGDGLDLERMLGHLFFPYVSTFSLSSKGPQPLSRITAQSSICDHENVQHEV